MLIKKIFTLLYRSLRENFIEHFLNNVLIQRGSKSFIDISTNIHNPKNIFIGKNSYINKNCYLWAGNTSTIKIGNNVLFGPEVKIFSANHIFSKNGLITDQKWDEKDVVIGNNTWIGANVIILPGSKIPNNCIIAAGTIINKKLKTSNVLYTGCPAKIKKYY